jgi:hypothetical protein
VPQAVLDTIAAVFEGKSDDLESTGEETVSVPAREVSRRQAVAKEQKDELVQEGLEDADSLEAPAEDAAEGEQTADEPAEESAEGEATEPVVDLDPNLRFAAQHVGGLSDDDINEFYQQNPTLATRVFENYLSAFSAMSRQSGMLPATSPQQTPAPAAQRQAQTTSNIDKILGNLKEFAEVNGEPLADFVKALHEEAIVPLRQMQAELAVAKQQAVAAEATNSTEKLAETFSDVYGKGEKVNLLQKTNRQKLYEVADQLRSGAYQQGHEMSVKDAINRAHLIVTADKQVAAGRKQVQQQVQKRAKQITARPTHRMKPSSPGNAKGETTAAEAYRQRATELGIDIGD